MTAHIDFASLPDAEAARLMAEMDGLSPRPYTTSLDAAVGWLGRMGLEWVRVNDTDGRFFVLVWRESNFQCYGQTVYESPTCPTARALCNAGWSAVQAREAGEA